MEKEKNEIVNQNTDEWDINLIDYDWESMEEILNQDIETIMTEIDNLGEVRELLTNPDTLGKEIYNSIFNQLGAQNGLDLSSDSLVNQYRNQHQNEDLKTASVDALRDKKYVETRKINSAASKTKKGIKDAYTGKIVKYNDGHQINTDHVVSRKELYGGEGTFRKRLRELSGNEVKDLANLKENLVATNESLNKSKGANSINNYLQNMEKRKEELIKNNKLKNDKIMKKNISEQEKKQMIKENNRRLKDKLDADSKKMKVVDKEARRAINKKIAKDATRNVTKEASTAALRSMLMSSVATLVKTIIDSLIDFWKMSNKNWSSLKNALKKGFTNFFHSIKSIIGNSISGGISSIINNLISLFGEAVGKIWGILKTGYTTLKNGIKIMSNKDMPLPIRFAEFGKTLAIGLGVASTAFLTVTINSKLIATFPNLAELTWPIIGSVSGFITEIILAILNGIIVGIVLYQINKFISKLQKGVVDGKIIQKNNEYLYKQNIQLAVVKNHSHSIKTNSLNEIDNYLKNSNDISKNLYKKIFEPYPNSKIDYDDLEDDFESLL